MEYIYTYFILGIIWSIWSYWEQRKYYGYVKISFIAFFLFSPAWLWFFFAQLIERKK